ncbi:MAG: RepB family protein [Candidatus Goldiibacteriota bacterium]
MAPKTVSFTVQMDKSVKDRLKHLCEEEGYKMNKFIEKAVKHEIMREQHKEDLLIIDRYEKHGKKTLVDYKKFAKEYGLK